MPMARSEFFVRMRDGCRSIFGDKLSGISGGRFRSLCAGQAISAACGQKRERRRLEGTFQRTDASGCSFEGALFDGASAKRQAAHSEESAHGKNFMPLPHNANPWQACYNRVMNKQMSLSALSDELTQVRTKKREFLAEIDRIVPWGEWISLIRPYYYKGERGNKPYDLERILRIYLVQNLYNLSDMATVAEVIDSRAFPDFCGVESSNQVPDGDTLGRFRNILLKNGIQQELFAQVVELLTQRGLILKRGTIVDSTFIEAPSSTKNQKKERDPEAHSAKK